MRKKENICQYLQRTINTERINLAREMSWQIGGAQWMWSDPKHHRSRNI